MIATLLILAVSFLGAGAWGVWRQPGKTDAGTITLIDRFLHPIETNLPLGHSRLVDSVQVSADGRIGMIVASGAVFRSDDGGARWHQLSTRGNAAFHRIAMSSDGRHAIAPRLFGGLLRTADGGATWTTQTSGIGEDERVFFVTLSSDGRRGLAVALDATRILRTTDGAATWSAQPGQVGDIALAADGLRAVQVGDNGEIRRTMDSGATWTSLVVPPPSRLEKVTLSADGRIGLAAGRDGVMLRTGDGGATWTRLPPLPYPALYFPSVVLSGDGKRAIAVAANAGGGHWSHVSSDGGMTWMSRPLGERPYYQQVALSNDGLRGIMVGNSFSPMVFRTSDGGLSWQPLDPPGRAAPYWPYGAALVAVVLLGLAGVALRSRGVTRSLARS